MNISDILSVIVRGLMVAVVVVVVVVVMVMIDSAYYP